MDVISDRTAESRRLLFSVADEVRSEVKSAVLRQSLTLSQANALVALNEPMSMHALATRTRCDPSSITYLVDKLEQSGLVVRTPHPTDRRSKLLVATSAGERARAAVLQEFTQNSVLTRLNDDELAQFETTLRRLVR